MALGTRTENKRDSVGEGCRKIVDEGDGERDTNTVGDDDGNKVGERDANTVGEDDSNRVGERDAGEGDGNRVGEKTQTQLARKMATELVKETQTQFGEGGGNRVGERDANTVWRGRR